MAIPTDPPAPADPTKMLLQQQKELSELQKALAETKKAEAEALKASVEAQKAAVEAALPKGEAKPLAGTVTMEGDPFGYLAEVVAYHTLKNSAKKIATEINDWSPAPSEVKILIVPAREIAPHDFALLQLEKQMALLAQLLEEQTQKNSALLTGASDRPSPAASYESFGLESAALPVVAAVVTAVPAVVSTLADLAGYFQADYTLKGRAVPLSHEALSALVAGGIRRHQVYLLNFSLLSSSEIVEQFDALVGQKRTLEKTQAALKAGLVQPTTAALETLTPQLAKLQAELEALNQAAPPTPTPPADGAEVYIPPTEAPAAQQWAQRQKNLAQEIQNQQVTLKKCQAQLALANQAVAESASLLTALGEFVTAAMHAPNEQTPPVLLQAALRQQIRAQGITHLLHLSVLSSGGEAITQKRWFRSGDLAFTGGSVIAYMLAGVDGQVARADAKVALARLSLNLDAPEKMVFTSLPVPD